MFHRSSLLNNLAGTWLRHESCVRYTGSQDLIHRVYDDEHLVYLKSVVAWAEEMEREDVSFAVPVNFNIFHFPLVNLLFRMCTKTFGINRVMDVSNGLS